MTTKYYKYTGNKYNISLNSIYGEVWIYKFESGKNPYQKYYISIFNPWGVNGMAVVVRIVSTRLSN